MRIRRGIVLDHRSRANHPQEKAQPKTETGLYYLQESENEALTCTLSVIQTLLLLFCVYLFRRLAGKEALTA